MEVALDDYIKTKNITRNSGRGRRGAKLGRGAGRGGPGAQKLSRSPRFSRGVSKKAVGGRSFDNSRTVSRANLANGDRWQHDLFGAGAAGMRGLRTSGGGGAKLMISNLEYGVSDTDINDLFAEFGMVKKASVHYDRSGRSIGTAEVVFARAVDAMSAMRKYNGVPLDGRPMDIQLVSGVGGGTGGSPVAPSRVGVSRGRSNFGGRGARGARGGLSRGRGRAGARGGAQRRGGKPEVTQEQLDMELDEYQAATSNTA